MARKSTADIKREKQRAYNKAWRDKRKAETAEVNKDLARVMPGRDPTPEEWAKLEKEINAKRAALMQEGPSAADLIAALAHMGDSFLIRELAKRSGTLGAVMKAQELVIKKSEDYNQSGMKGGEALHADRDNYFPFGTKSYVHMLFTKTQRLVSLELKGGAPNFEGLRDTALDLINYASFFVERLDRPNTPMGERP